MTGRLVDLVLSETRDRDATSTHARTMRDVLEADGHRVRFVVERPTGSDDEVLLLDRWKADADLTILQHSIGSLAASEVARRGVPVVLNYHNVTPPHFVEPWEPDRIRGLQWGRDQLWELRPVTHHAIAASDYNARELRDVGYHPVVVSPVLFSSPGAGVKSGGGCDFAAFSKVTLLFVGRLSPNKCQQDLVGVLAAVVALGVDARLVLVGSVSSSGFAAAVEGLAAELGVLDRLVLAGSVSVGELAGWYSVADVFVCVSEHEGFCVPVVEAMGFGVPVVAFGGSAVGETVGEAGVVLREKSPGLVAEAVVRVLSDSVVRERLVGAGRVRAGELGGVVARERMREVLAPLLHTTTP